MFHPSVGVPGHAPADALSSGRNASACPLGPALRGRAMKRSGVIGRFVVPVSPDAAGPAIGGSARPALATRV